MTPEKKERFDLVLRQMLELQKEAAELLPEDTFKEGWALVALHLLRSHMELVKVYDVRHEQKRKEDTDGKEEG